MPNFLEAYNRDLVVLMDKMIEYQVALLTFFKNKKKRSIYSFYYIRVPPIFLKSERVP